MSAYISFNKSQPVEDGESTAAPSINVGDVTKPALVDMELLKPNKELHHRYTYVGIDITQQQCLEHHFSK